MRKTLVWTSRINCTNRKTRDKYYMWMLIKYFHVKNYQTESRVIYYNFSDSVLGNLVSKFIILKYLGRIVIIITICSKKVFCKTNYVLL